MPTIPYQDPDRRCKPLEEWPEEDRAWWQAALVPGDLLQQGGSRAGYSERTNRGLVSNYGRWLTWLDRRGQLDRTDSPADRITRAQLRAYVADLERYNATHTILVRLGDLLAAARVMEPHRDWTWINQIARPIRARHQPARPKRPRLVPTSVLFNLGVDLMAGAERVTSARDRAVEFRPVLRSRIHVMCGSPPASLGIAGLRRPNDFTIRRRMSRRAGLCRPFCFRCAAAQALGRNLRRRPIFRAGGLIWSGSWLALHWLRIFKSNSATRRLLPLTCAT